MLVANFDSPGGATGCPTLKEGDAKPLGRRAPHLAVPNSTLPLVNVATPGGRHPVAVGPDAEKARPPGGSRRPAGRRRRPARDTADVLLGSPGKGGNTERHSGNRRTRDGRPRHGDVSSCSTFGFWRHRLPTIMRPAWPTWGALTPTAVGNVVRQL
jgi:hypothetical protein